MHRFGRLTSLTVAALFAIAAPIAANAPIGSHAEPTPHPDSSGNVVRQIPVTETDFSWTTHGLVRTPVPT